MEMGSREAIFFSISSPLSCAIVSAFYFPFHLKTGGEKDHFISGLKLQTRKENRKRTY
jgi:hypothetical protein